MFAEMVEGKFSPYNIVYVCMCTLGYVNVAVMTGWFS